MPGSNANEPSSAMARKPEVALAGLPEEILLAILLCRDSAKRQTQPPASIPPLRPRLTHGGAPQIWSRPILLDYSKRPESSAVCFGTTPSGARSVSRSPLFLRVTIAGELVVSTTQVQARTLFKELPYRSTMMRISNPNGRPLLRRRGVG